MGKDRSDLQPPDWACLRDLFASAAAVRHPKTDDDAMLDVAEERAAILEYDAGLSRQDAEAQAYQILGTPRPAGA